MPLELRLRALSRPLAAKVSDRSPWDWYADSCRKDLIDALRGGIRDALPVCGTPALYLTRVHASKLM